jgi:cytoskeletal protein CcmA (bactofilin family)
MLTNFRKTAADVAPPVQAQQPVSYQQAAQIYAQPPPYQPVAVAAAPVAAPVPEPAAASAPAIPALLTVIDASLSITGDLQSEGELQVKGRVLGNIHCQTLIVEVDGAIEGGIVADQVLIHGRTKGFVRATHIELRPTAVVESDLYHATLIVHDGAMFEGVSETNKDQRHNDQHTGLQVDELRAMADRMRGVSPVAPTQAPQPTAVQPRMASGLGWR